MLICLLEYTALWDCIIRYNDNQCNLQEMRTWNRHDFSESSCSVLKGYKLLAKAYNLHSLMTTSPIRDVNQLLIHLCQRLNMCYCGPSTSAFCHLPSIPNVLFVNFFQMTSPLEPLVKYHGNVHQNTLC